MPRIVGSVTQGGNDAFAVNSIQTALSGQTRLAYDVKRIILETPRLAQGAAANWQVQLSRRTKAAIANITDVDILAYWYRYMHFTTSGSEIEERIIEQVPQTRMLIVEDPIYLLIDSNGTSLAQTAYVAIEYDLVEISEVDRLTLLTESLQ
jgi:hypothetical protein